MSNKNYGNIIERVENLDKKKEIAKSINSALKEIIEVVEKINKLKGVPHVNRHDFMFDTSHPVFKSLRLVRFEDFLYFDLILHKPNFFKILFMGQSVIHHTFYIHTNSEFPHDSREIVLVDYYEKLYAKVMNHLYEIHDEMKALSTGVNE